MLAPQSASPLYCAVIVCVPAASVPIVNADDPSLATGTAGPKAVAPSRKVTEPVGAGTPGGSVTPATDELNVTD